MDLQQKHYNHGQNTIKGETIHVTNAQMVYMDTQVKCGRIDSRKGEKTTTTTTRLFSDLMKSRRKIGKKYTNLYHTDLSRQKGARMRCYKPSLMLGGEYHTMRLQRKI